jgi:hypothetical protein
LKIVRFVSPDLKSGITDAAIETHVYYAKITETTLYNDKMVKG